MAWPGCTGAANTSVDEIEAQYQLSCKRACSSLTNSNSLACESPSELLLVDFRVSALLKLMHNFLVSLLNSAHTRLPISATCFPLPAHIGLHGKAHVTAPVPKGPGPTWLRSLALRGFSSRRRMRSCRSPSKNKKTFAGPRGPPEVLRLCRFCSSIKYRGARRCTERSPAAKVTTQPV